jgi:acetolactate synthase-1/2/3 large subunit
MKTVKTENRKTKKATVAPRATPKAEIGQPMMGRDILVRALEREGVEYVFAYPGGASMEIHQALTRSTIRTILPRHEQGGGFAADGYARATGRVGVCMATSGPGATNLVTAIADAYMDSVPLLAITGQVPQAMIGKGAFQETDFFGMTLPVVKHSYLITDVNDIPRIVKEAIYIATTGRPGPVVIDFPKNLQISKTQPVWPAEVRLRGYDPDKRADDLALNEIIGLIAKAERPVLYCGGGIITANASAELRQFAEATGIPVTTTIMGCGAFPETHSLSLRWLGMHGSATANWAVSGEFKQRKSPDEPLVKIKPGADLLLAFGVRFDDRAYRHRPVGTQQKPQGPSGHRERHQIRPGPLERNDPPAAHAEKIPGLARPDRGVETARAVSLRDDGGGQPFRTHAGSYERARIRGHPAPDGHRDAL